MKESKDTPSSAFLLLDAPLCECVGLSAKIIWKKNSAAHDAFMNCMLFVWWWCFCCKVFQYIFSFFRDTEIRGVCFVVLNLRLNFLCLLWLKKKSYSNVLLTTCIQKWIKATRRKYEETKEKKSAATSNSGTRERGRNLCTMKVKAKSSVAVTRWRAQCLATTNCEKGWKKEIP